MADIKPGRGILDSIHNPANRTTTPAELGHHGETVGKFALGGQEKLPNSATATGKGIEASMHNPFNSTRTSVARQTTTVNTSDPASRTEPETQSALSGQETHFHLNRSARRGADISIHNPVHQSVHPNPTSLTNGQAFTHQSYIQPTAKLAQRYSIEDLLRFRTELPLVVCNVTKMDNESKGMLSHERKDRLS
jgi:hypothetical protein